MNRMFRVIVIGACLSLALSEARPAVGEQESNVKQGIYSEEQAKRGASTYREKCVSCHGAELSGGVNAPSLTGSNFFSSWEGKTLASLGGYIRENMPEDQPSTLDTQQAADLIAFILKTNKLPAGNAQLPLDTATLDQIKIVTP